MILIIADDLSGAAELAGIAASRGYSAEVHTELDLTSQAEVIAVDSKTRSLSPKEAGATVWSICETAESLSPDWIYKKTDSVLRGNVRVELEALMKVTGKERVLFIPANPGKGRCIRHGEYFVNDVPLNQTVFANDPDHPQRTANAVAALGTGNEPVHSIRVRQPAPDRGIIIPDVANRNDVVSRVGDVDSRTLAAGAAEFFSLLLDTRLRNRAFSAPTAFQNGRALFVCGSLAAWEQDIAQRMAAKQVPVVTLDEFTELRGALSGHRRAMLAIGNSANPDNASPKELLGALIEHAIATSELNWTHIFLEGGATASAFIERKEWTRFKALPSDLTGVGCLRPVHDASAPTLFVKPGSYPWPEEIWQFL